MDHDPVARIILGTMTFGYRGRGVRIDDPARVRGCTSRGRSTSWVSTTRSAAPSSPNSCRSFAGTTSASTPATPWRLAAAEAGPLPADIVAALDRAAEITRPAWPPVPRTG
ncbi:hypothetical protein [Crossiella cryophila]|uniref:Uncharacterized protein n=1 Tax=Crossiella cryophila TaxID=43355 RepID=A0A7W7CGV7_9PSEU|nr:hypothetical protein [Crossiella cryophila]MBB4680981.1 hypothetical protein [Crossiella cryophila]